MKLSLSCSQFTGVLLAALMVHAFSVTAQVPTMIGYQGRITVEGQPFQGTGQFKFALVDGAGARLWSHDGTGGAEAEPASELSLAVTNGLFAVLLGDTAVPNMSAPIAASLFAEHTEVYVRVWFDDGAHGRRRLVPDQRITSAGYAMVAHTAREAAPGAIDGSMLAGNAVTGAKIQDGTVTANDVDAGSFENTFWRAQGNSGTTPGADYVGTRDGQPLEIRVNRQRAMRFEPGNSPNLIGGYNANSVAPGQVGATIAGGGGAGVFEQRVTHSYGTIGGGFGNLAGSGATVAGGEDNDVTGTQSFVGGGADHRVTGFNSAIGGGYTNHVSGDYSVVAGGALVSVAGDKSAAGGGENNRVNGNWAFVGGGRDNVIQNGANYGTIGGGVNNEVAGQYGFAGGRNAKARHDGATVWADSGAGDFVSARNDEYAIRAEGGLRLQSQRGIALNAGDRPIITRGWDAFSTAAPAFKQGHGRWGLFMEFTALVLGMPTLANRYIRFGRYELDGTYVTLAEIRQDGTFTTAGPVNPPSDRRVKQDFEDVDAREILERVLAVPVRAWRYTNAPSVRHIGPVAQDFHAAFEVGADDKSIATVDADGVALAAIQGLNAKLEEQRRELETKDGRIEALEAAVRELKELLKGSRIPRR